MDSTFDDDIFSSLSRMERVIFCSEPRAGDGLRARGYFLRRSRRARGFSRGRRETTSRDDKTSSSTPRVYYLGMGAEQRPNVLTCGAVSVRNTQPPSAARGARSIVLNDGCPVAAEARASFFFRERNGRTFCSRNEASTTKTKKAFDASSESARRMYNEEALGMAFGDFRGLRESGVFRITKRRSARGLVPPERRHVGF